jgi:hypothetical protein
MIKDPLITNQLESYVTRRFLVKTLYDLVAYGNAFIQLIPNLEGTRIVTLNPVSALHCRIEMYDKEGNINNVAVSGKWPDADEKSINTYPLLNEIDPVAHLQRMKDENLLKGNTPFLHIQNSFSSNDFYPLPNWYSAKLWIDIANKVPKIINAGMDNVLNIMFLVRIPYSYFQKKYPEEKFTTEKERRDAIQQDIDMLEEKFTTVENAKKALITFFGEDSTDKWEIEIIQPNFSQENFITSTAADSQIAIAAGYSPDLLGLMYGNSKGGSMQRELLLLQYALSWELRQQILEPLEMMIKLNEPKFENLQLRIRNTFLTTLDTGAGTAQTLS